MPEFVKNNDKLSLLYQIFIEKPFIIGFIFAYFVYSDLKAFTNSSLHQQAQTITELQNLNAQAIKRNEELSADFKLYMEENSKILKEITLRLENLEKRIPEK